MPEIIDEYLKKVAHPIIFGSVFISVCACALFLETYLLLGQPLKFDALSFLIFFATLSLYNTHRLLSYARIKKEDYGVVTSWTATNRFTVFMLALIGAGGVAFFIFQMTLQVVAILIVLGVVSMLYELPVIRYRKTFYRLRNLWTYKIFMITSAWAVATAVLPAIQSGVPLTEPSVWLIVLERMLFVFLIAVCFDARDMTFDLKDGLKTIPIRFGIPLTLRLYKVVSALFILVAILHYFLISPRYGAGLAMVLSGVITFFIISRTHPRKSAYYYLFVVDGMLLLQFLLVAMLSMMNRM